MKLLFDEMLKRTVSWCRILGIDSEFLSGKSDTALLEYAKNKKLIFVTRDAPLYQRCVKAGVSCLLIKSDVIEEQIAQIVKETGAVISFPEKTRCAACNGELDVVSRESVKAEVPETTYETQNKFWKCRSCGKIYWEGGHWRNIRKVYDKVKELLGAA